MRSFKYILLILSIYSGMLSAQVFAPLQKKLDGGYYKLVSDLLYFKIYGEYNSATLTFNIYNDAHSVVASNSLNSSVISSTDLNSGNNEYSINCANGSIFPSGYYILEIINEKKEKLYLRFKK